MPRHRITAMFWRRSRLLKRSAIFFDLDTVHVFLCMLTWVQRGLTTLISPGLRVACFILRCCASSHRSWCLLQEADTWTRVKQPLFSSLESARPRDSPVEHKVFTEPQHWRRPLNLQSSKCNVMPITRLHLWAQGYMGEKWKVIELLKRKATDKTLALKMLCLGLQNMTQKKEGLLSVSPQVTAHCVALVPNGHG